MRRLVALLCLAVVGCDVGAAHADGAPIRTTRPAQAQPDSVFAALHARVSEPGGYFDTDNLISNESGYLKVMGALEARAPAAGAYAGVSPGQNFSYIAAIRPRLAFIVDIRRDNTLHHLLLKALMERAPTRIEFLAGLHGRAPPSDPAAWRERDIEEILDWIEAAEAGDGRISRR